ncbi:MAG: hypothetical protein ACNA77_06170 [Opitutales bacterium]
MWLPLFATSSFAGDLGFAVVLKGQEFAQTSAHNVALGEWNSWYQTGEVQNEGDHEESVFTFEAFGLESAPGALLSGTVTTPGGDTLPLGRGEHQEDPELGLESGAASPLELDQLWPDGDYTLAFTGAVDGAYAPVTLSLSGSTYPPVPQITNFEALQSVDAATATALTWSPMGGAVEDFILFRIVSLGEENEGEMIYMSGLPGTPEALNGTATATSIPAGTLQPGQDYQGELLFFKMADSHVGAALYMAAYYKLTGFLIRAAALPGESMGAEFLRANPRNGMESVGRDAVVAFHFSHPMTPEDISISWTKDWGPLSTGTFAYHWTRGNTVLLCEFSTAFPGNSEIGWSLNLGGFKDAAGFPLNGNADGSFRTGTNNPETPPDLEMIGLLKSQYFIQTGVTPVFTGRYEANVEIEATSSNRLKSATLTSPDGRTSPLYADIWKGDDYEVPGDYGSKEDLDRFYPNGDYQFSIDGIADGAQLVTLSLGETDQYPEAPTITNLAALQGLDPAASATIHWNALSGWSNEPQVGDGFIQIAIENEFGHEIFWMEGSEMLSGTECEIPPGTLQPGRSYEAELMFIRITDWEEELYPGVMGAAGFESITQFTITTGGQIELPTVQIERTFGTARLSFAHMLVNSNYVLEVSSDLQRWTTLAGIWSGNPSFEDYDAHYLKSRFYRLREFSNNEDLRPNISIQGTVWMDFARTVPVAGAIVGTSLDGQSVQTDIKGTFFLITDTPAQNGEASYNVEIINGSQSRIFGPHQWGDQPRQQEFILEGF